MPYNSTELNKKVTSLEKSIQKLQNIAWVVGIVATIFGISGGYGALALKGAKGELSQLQADIKQVDTKISSSFEKKESEAAARLNEAAGHLKANVLNSVEESREKLSRWGNPSPQSESERDVVFGGQSGLSEVKFCPNGQYVIGMQVIDQDTGGHCVSCINGVRFICRPLGR
jgi:hypothetical protein